MTFIILLWLICSCIAFCIAVKYWGSNQKVLDGEDIMALVVAFALGPITLFIFFGSWITCLENIKNPFYKEKK